MEGWSADDFARIFPIERIYILPLQECDRYRECKIFELGDWRVRVKCVGIDRKNNIVKYKRDELMPFGNRLI